MAQIEKPWFLCSCMSVPQRHASQVDVHGKAATNLVVHMWKKLGDVAEMLLPIAKLRFRQCQHAAMTSCDVFLAQLA